jgi:hypothetical protein
MHRVVRFPKAAPPQHVGSALRVGETVLLRTPREWSDVLMQLRAVDISQGTKGDVRYAWQLTLRFSGVEYRRPLQPVIGRRRRWS